MRWLQWATYDLANGTGGVEVHARLLHRELLALGVDSHLSSDVKILSQQMDLQNWDVIQTHGSSPLPTYRGSLTNNRLVFLKHSFPLRIHTLHGSTLGRMSACREWLWPGGYAAYFREWVGMFQSQVVLSVHPSIHLYNLAKVMGKKTAVCWNGWNSAEGQRPEQQSVLPEQLLRNLEKLKPFFCYVGRGEDPVKNAVFIEEIFQNFQAANLIAIPGSGFQETQKIFHTGTLSPAQVLSVLKQSQGLLLSSHYEGLPLVVLEALGNGIPVFTARSGGLCHLSEDLNGLTFLPPASALWKQTLQAALKQKTTCFDPESNRHLIPSWKFVAQTALNAVECYLKENRIAKSIT